MLWLLASVRYAAAGIFIMPKRDLIALSLPLTDRDFDTLVAGVEEFVSARRSLLQ